LYNGAEGAAREATMSGIINAPAAALGRLLREGSTTGRQKEEEKL